ncbi:hypothetical protein Tco_0086220 [Tanacetum coccineum]
MELVAAACASMAALVAASLAVIKKDTKGVWIRLKTMRRLDTLSDMWADVIFKFCRLGVGDQRRCMGFNMEMNSKYANGSEYTNVQWCADIRFKGLLTCECALLKTFEDGFAQFTVGLGKAVLISLVVLTDTAAFEEFCLAVVSVLRGDFIKTAFGTNFPFG